MYISYIPAGFNSGMNNLMWIISTDNSDSVTVIDPGYSEEIIQYLKLHSLKVSDILITHHHYDHTDGVSALLALFPEAKVYGPKNSPFQHITYSLEENDSITIANLDAQFKIIATPGHTLDHISYHCADKNICFVGDTVFGAGAGGLFEGTPDIFLHSTQKIMALPAETTLYYGHDYTLENLYFARKVEKSNPHIQERIETCKSAHQNNQYNGHSTVALEHLSNPFWRYEQQEIKESCERYANKKLTTSVEVFATIREWR